MTPGIREKARVIAWPHSNLIEPRAADALIDNIVHAIQDERDAAIGECAKLAREFYGPYWSKGYRNAGIGISDAILAKLKGDAS